MDKIKFNERGLIKINQPKEVGAKNGGVKERPSILKDNVKDPPAPTPKK